MSAYVNQVKAYLDRYQTEVGGDGLLDPHLVAEWAYKNGDQVADDLDYVPMPPSVKLSVAKSWSEIKDASGKTITVK